jgi:hypothetical protein
LRLTPKIIFYPPPPKISKFNNFLFFPILFPFSLFFFSLFSFHSSPRDLPHEQRARTNNKQRQNTKGSLHEFSPSSPSLWRPLLQPSLSLWRPSCTLATPPCSSPLPSLSSELLMARPWSFNSSHGCPTMESHAQARFSSWDEYNGCT